MVLIWNWIKLYKITSKLIQLSNSILNEKMLNKWYASMDDFSLSCDIKLICMQAEKELLLKERERKLEELRQINADLSTIGECNCILW